MYIKFCFNSAQLFLYFMAPAKRILFKNLTSWPNTNTNWTSPPPSHPVALVKLYVEY